jgi:hypothetical protein
MEPKKEYSEHEEDGKRVTRPTWSTYDDPETKTHVEQIKIEDTEDKPDKES